MPNDIGHMQAQVLKLKIKHLYSSQLAVSSAFLSFYKE